MSQFLLKINLGNDAMQTDADIATALRLAANDINCNGTETLRNIRDVNGNNVGSFRKTK